jgi:hypothetical protein
MSEFWSHEYRAEIGSVLAAQAGRPTNQAKAEATERNAQLGRWPKGKARKKN